MTAASAATAPRGTKGRVDIENLHKYGTRWPREVIILISESSELAEDNAAGEQVNELRRVMRASETVK